MPRNITAAQTRAQDFYESDMQAQNNQVKYNDSFFRMAQKIQMNYFLKI